MRTAAAFICLVTLAITANGAAASQEEPARRAPDPGDTHLAIHNVRAAHEITLGAGTKVGILDRSFGVEAHPELYAGSENFLGGGSNPQDGDETHQGYWMALVLHEIAPEAEIYALEAVASDEATRVEAMVRALEWAVEQKLDVVTYCSETFSESARATLDPAVEKTVEAGVVVVFLDYSHRLNLLPAGFGPPVEQRQRDPDLHIFSYDCTTLFAGQFLALLTPDDDGIQLNRPFLGRPSAGPVTAGLVALLKSVDPEASPSEIKKILMETSRSMEYQGLAAARVPDAFEAVTVAVGLSPGYPEALAIAKTQL